MRGMESCACDVGPVYRVLRPSGRRPRRFVPPPRSFRRAEAFHSSSNERWTEAKTCTTTAKQRHAAPLALPCRSQPRHNAREDPSFLLCFLFHRIGVRWRSLFDSNGKGSGTQDKGGRTRRVWRLEPQPKEGATHVDVSAMFFLLELKKNVQLSPRFFGPKMVSTIQDKLIAEVCENHANHSLRGGNDETKPSRSALTHARSVERRRKRKQVEGTCSGRYGYIIGVLGKPNVGKGFVVEDHSGQAVFEVKYQAIVFRPFKGEVLDAIVYHVSKMGFFAQAGPLELFVSTHLIPSEYAFSSIDEPCFVSDDSMVRGTQIFLTCPCSDTKIESLTTGIHPSPCARADADPTGRHGSTEDHRDPGGSFQNRTFARRSGLELLAPPNVQTSQA